MSATTSAPETTRKPPVLVTFGQEENGKTILPAAETNDNGSRKQPALVTLAEPEIGVSPASETRTALGETKEGVARKKPVLVTFGEDNDAQTASTVSTTPAAAPVRDFLSTVPIYVVHLVTQKERLARLKTRLAHHGLHFVSNDPPASTAQPQVHVVSALTPESKYVQRMFKGWPDASPRALALGTNTKPQASYYSHIKAIKEWLRSSSSSSEWAMFLEDDAVPHDEFRSLLNGLWPQVTAGCNMVLLTHFVTKWDSIQHVTTNLCTMTPHVWGAIGYLVRRSWAERMIKHLDRPVVDLIKTKVPCKWERILQSYGPTLFTRPCLLIEESVNSTIQADSQLAEHLRYFTQFRHNFKRYECKQVLDTWAAFEAAQRERDAAAAATAAATVAAAARQESKDDGDSGGSSTTSSDVKKGASISESKILSIVDQTVFGGASTAGAAVATGAAAASTPILESKSRQADMPLLGLCVICKNEAHIIHEMIDSVARHCQFALFMDTGSTDGTQDKIAARCKHHQLAYEIHDRPWDSKTRGDFQFNVNRSMALELIKGKCQFALIMDADDVLLTAAADNKQTLLDQTLVDKHPEMDGFFVLVKSGGYTYPRAHVLRMDRPWWYVDEIHEQAQLNVPFAPDHGKEELTAKMYNLAARSAMCHGGHKKLIHDKGEFMIDSRRLGDRTKQHASQTAKYTKDALQLQQMMQRDPDCGRYVYLCAQSWRDAGDYKRAYELYKKYIEMADSVHKQVPNLAFGFDARLNLAKCAAENGCSLLEWTVLLVEAWKFDKRRAEPLVQLIERYNDEGTPYLSFEYAQQMRPTIKYDPMLSHANRETYEWKLDFWIIQAAVYAEEYQHALDMMRHNALKPGTDLNKALPANVQMQLRTWMLQCLKSLPTSARDASAGAGASAGAART